MIIGGCIFCFKVYFFTFTQKQCKKWVRQVHKVSELALWISALQTVFTEQIMPNKLRDGYTQPTIGMYSIHTRSKQIPLNMDLRIFLKKAMAHFKREVLSKFSILRTIVYAVAVNDVAEL